MGRSFDSSFPHVSRAKQCLKPRSRPFSLGARFLLILVLMLLAHDFRLFFVYRNELRAKYSSTSFATINSSAWQIDSQDSGIRQDLLAHRQEWRVLGTGWEGTTYVFNNYVIKTFVPGRSPFRNCVSGGVAGRWPTEIPASLTFGGSYNLKKSSPDTSSNTSNTASTSAFLPVTANFLASSDPKSREEWHLVTPLLPGGNLNTLAKQLIQRHPYKHYREVDAAYRATFHRLLGALERLHSKGFCHDDVKPSNIFVQDDSQWILGDLGNVRHLTHPYHSSRLWLKDNGQLPDCRANDVLRVLKSYLHFVRASSNDADAFDTALYEGRESLSRLFWWTLEDLLTMSAAELRVRSGIESPEQQSKRHSHDNTLSPQFIQTFLDRKWARRSAVDKVLETKFSERSARWFAKTWIFGVPIDECSRV